MPSSFTSIPSVSILNLWGEGISSPGNVRINRESVGRISWNMYLSPTFQNFAAFPGGFEFYRQQMSAAEVFPVAYLEDLEIDPECRRLGYGASALRIVLARAKRRGAKTAFIRVGFYETEESSAFEDRDWKVGWYEREGFIQLKHEHSATVVPYMWHPLLKLRRPAKGVSVLRDRIA